MKWLTTIAVTLALILLIGCETQRKSTSRQLPAPPPLSPTPIPIPATVEDPSLVTLRKSVALVRDLTTDATGALPDALLNRTQCFIVGIAGAQEAVSTCRSASAPYSWNSPETVALKGRTALQGNLLLFVISDRAHEALSAGSLDVSRFSVVPGKTRSDAALLTTFDLGHDLFAYRYTKSGLAGAAAGFDQIKPVLLADTPHASTRVASAGSGRSELASEYVDWVKSYFNSITPIGIIIHHSAVIPSMKKVPTALEEVDQFHSTRGFAIECDGREYHVAYHYLIFPNGKVEKGRPERCEGAHAKGYNSFIGISLVGDFSAADNPTGSKGPRKPTSRQLKSLIRLTREMQRKYNIPVQRILRHSDVASTRCPGDQFPFKDFLSSLEFTPEPSRRASR